MNNVHLLILASLFFSLDFLLLFMNKNQNQNPKAF